MPSLTAFLAETTPFSPDTVNAVRDAFRNVHDPHDPLATFRWVLTALILILLMLGALWFNRWRQKHELRSRPFRVFHRLASELGLASDEQWLLIRIARQQALPSALTLLLSRGTLRHHAEKFVETLGPARRPKVMRQVARVRRALFLTPAA